MTASDSIRIYRNHRFDSEQAMLIAVIDRYRCVEDFAAGYLGAWRAVCSDARIRGGLSTICGRERAHATALEARLLEIGGRPKAEMPADRQPDLEFYGSTEHTDAAKLERVARQLLAPNEPLRPLIEAIELIKDDLETRELLLTILEDERASLRWLVDAAGIAPQPE